MKHFYLLAIFLCTVSGAGAQIINIPDANFKSRLLSSSATSNIAKNAAGVRIKIDVNNDGEIQFSEAVPVAHLALNYPGYLPISSIEGILGFTNLISLQIANQQLTSLDLHGLELLNSISILGNPLVSIDLHDCVSMPGFSYYGNNVIQHVNLSGCNSMQVIDCGANWSMETFNVSGCTAATSINIGSAIVTELDLSSLSNVTFLNIAGIPCSDLDFSNMEKLETLRIPFVPVTTLDLSACHHLTSLVCYYMYDLVHLNIKNGSAETLQFSMEDPVQYICADEADMPYVNAYLASHNMSGTCNSNPYCTFEPGGKLYSVTGNSRLDQDLNGCDDQDLIFPEMLFTVSNGNLSGQAMGGFNGSYTYPLPEGTHTISPVFENPGFFNVTPENVVVTFPDTASPFEQDFCITPNGIHPDVEIVILPLEPLRPGATVSYKLIYRNVGNQVLSGEIQFAFDQSRIDFIESQPVIAGSAQDQCSWNYTDFQPFESREIDITMTVHTPQGNLPVNAGDITYFIATINPIAGDAHPDNNTFALKQTVVGSYDPNDKTCLEGDVVGPEMAGEYVHYIVRFENTGTYFAENIVIKDIIDIGKYDISSLRPIGGSAPFTYAVDGEKVEFFFADINLPFDDENNDGYIAFKIKTLDSLTVGDTFTNFASIYFDYNFPIVTNTAATTIQVLSNTYFESPRTVTLYPNPASNTLNIEADAVLRSVKIYNLMGQLVYSAHDNLQALNISSLLTATYFIRIDTDNGQWMGKFIKCQ